MIVSIVTFKLPKRWTVDEAATVFKSTAPLMCLATALAIVASTPPGPAQAR